MTGHENMTAQDHLPGKDFLWPHLRDLPYFRGLLRAVEARFYQDFDLASPTLDVGCGDGHFATVAFERKLEVGLDPWGGPIREAAQHGAYLLLTQAEGACMPFPSGSFGSAISNSVLEHIPDIDPVLAETARVLKPGGLFLFAVPNHNFNPNLSVARFFDRAGLKGPAARYRRLFDRIARHQHLDAPEVWQKRLEAAGFDVVRHWNYFSPAALRVLEWGHLGGIPALAARKLTGRWVIVRQPWNLALTRRLVEPYYNESPEREDGVCTFFVARRR